jgi:hypothetical protein
MHCPVIAIRIFLPTVLLNRCIKIPFVLVERFHDVSKAMDWYRWVDYVFTAAGNRAGARQPTACDKGDPGGARQSLKVSILSPPSEKNIM